MEGLKTLWKSAKLEVESVIRETCDRLLGDPKVSKEKLRLRAVALELMGEAYMSVKKENDPAGVLGDKEEFVKVETKASEEREAGAAGAGAKPATTDAKSGKEKEAGFSVPK